MTFNWGHKLMLGFMLFAGMIAYLVYRCSNTKYDLVSKEYYKDELVYQQVIDGTNRANKLSSRVNISQGGSDIIIRLPNEMKNTVVKGTLWFYCADNAQKDRKLPLEVNADALETLNGASLLPGNYTVKISWEANGQSYYSEQLLTVKRS